MRTGSLCLLVVLCVALISVGCEAATEQVIMGAVASVASDGGFIRMDTDEGVLVVEPADDVKILRGQVGLDLRAVKLQDLAPGDRLVTVINQYGNATSIKAFFGIVKGAFERLDGQKLVFSDGRTVPIITQTQVVTNDGKTSRPADIKKNSSLTCRVNPITGQAWTVLVSPAAKVVAQPAKPAPENKPIEPKKTPVTTSISPDRPQIKSITYSAPSPLKGGDLLTVDMTGTPGAKAILEIKNLISPTSMKEISQGVYHTTLTVPKGKTASGVPLVGRLEINGLKAIPVQASRLITIESDSAPAVTMVKAEPLDNPKPQPSKIEVSAPVARVKIEEEPRVVPQVVVPVQKPEDKRIEQTVKASGVSITMPGNGAEIRKSITVKGKAEPDANIRVVITYNNSLAGILKLSGEVASQLIAVGKNGEFSVGPFALEGPLATQGLEFTIKAYYPDRNDHGTSVVKVIGARS